MKIVIWLLTGLILLGIIYAFSTCRAEQSDGRVVLTMFSPSFPSLVKLNRRRIAMFEKENPGIKVRLVLGDANKYLTMVTGGLAPDVGVGVHNDIPYYAKRGALMALDEYIAKDKDFSLDDYFPVAAQSVRYRGEIYGLPDNGSPIALVYNKDMFDEYNREHPKGPKLEYPNEKWTWDDFRYAAKALTRDDDNDGDTDVFGASVSFWRNRWPILVWQYGGDLLSADKKRCLMDTPEALAGVKLLHDIMWVDKSAPTAETQIAGASGKGAGKLFREERIAMLMDARYGYMNLKGKTKFTWDIAPLPKGPAGRTTMYISDVWMVSSKTKHPEKSWRLAKFLVSEASSRMCMETGRAVVSHRRVAEEILRNPEPGSGLPEHDYMWIEIMLDSRPKDFEYREMGRYFDKAMSEMTAISEGRDKPVRTPEEACRNFTCLYQKGLDILWKEEGGP